MQTSGLLQNASANELKVHRRTNALPETTVGLLTGCQDRHYAFGLALSLISKGLALDIIGSDEIDSPELHAVQNLRFLNFRGSQRSDVTFTEKLKKLFVYYLKLMQYAACSNPKVLHILWNNKFEYFDRTVLMLYYKMRGKKIALTAHNVNQAKRDSRDSLLNRTTLRIQYRLCDHIFTHTEKMKVDLCHDFAVREEDVTVFRYPINNAFPDTELSALEAKRKLGLIEDERAILFFGRIRPYKGVEYLLDAFRLLSTNEQANYRLIIAGEPKKGSESYLDEIQQSIKEEFSRGQALLRFQFIPDEDLELYFKGADVLVLPYKDIFQSGVLFLSYSFGLPVVATDVGSFREEIVEGSTGFLCRAGDPAELAKAIEKYFASDLFKNLRTGRQRIRDYANANYSWETVAEATCRAYAAMLNKV